MCSSDLLQGAPPAAAKKKQTARSAAAAPAVTGENAVAERWLQAMTLRIAMLAVLEQQLMTLNRSGQLPEHGACGRSADAEVSIGSRFETQIGHVEFGCGTQHQDRLLVAAASSNRIQKLQHAWRIAQAADEHHIVNLVPQSRHRIRGFRDALPVDLHSAIN